MAGYRYLVVDQSLCKMDKTSTLNQNRGICGDVKHVQSPIY